MRQSRFSDEQIIGMINEQEAGKPTAEVATTIAAIVIWWI